MVDRREQRRRQRRQAVIDVALRLFDEQGYDVTTVDSIADEAGISLRSFYRYFDAKDGLFAAMGSTLIGELLDRTKERQPTIGGLALVLAQVMDSHVGERPLELVFRLLREQPELRHKAALWRQGWAKELADGIARRRGTSEPSPEDLIVSTITIATVALGVDRWVMSPANESIRNRTEEALQALQTRL